MKKSFAYFIGWLAAFGLFNLITFIIPSDLYNGDKYDAMFWIGYIFITVFFVGQLLCMAYVFNSGSLQKTFYNLSLVKISISALITMLIVGGLSMSVALIPTWLGTILCFVVVAVYTIIAMKSIVSAESVAAVDKKVKTKTMFIKLLTADAQALISKSTDQQLVALANKVYEAVRYSDPMSDPALSTVEDKISDAFRDFSAAIENNQTDAAQVTSHTLIALINERNTKCKILK